MFRNNELLLQLKKKIRFNTPRVEGIVKKSDRGFGFLEIDAQTTYFIPPKNMKRVMHGDRIIAKVIFEKEKEIVEPEVLIEPFLKRFVGKIKKQENKIFVLPNYPFIKDLIQCTKIKKHILLDNVNNDDWVIAKLIHHKLNGDNLFAVELIDFIVDDTNCLKPWLVTLNSHNLQSTVPKIDKDEIIFDNFHKRTDLTSLNFITIDHSHTKDIDDAIFIERNEKKNFSIIVAIADPTAYISVGSRLDKIANDRMFTNYLPGFTVPMLPLELSENICSLLPNKKRPVLACKFTILSDGTLLEESIHFFLAWIISKQKLSYNEVSDWLENIGNWSPNNNLIARQIVLLHELCQSRILWRKNNALIFHEKPEYRFDFSNNYELKNIYIEKRRIAHRMIEEAMIVANICAAKILSKNLKFGIFNIHKGFSDICNAEHVISKLSKFKLCFTAEEIMTLKGFCKLYRFLNSNSDRYLETRIRRYQSFGEFSLRSGPHFSLGLEEYATWTSPIRKYGDIINHRLLKSIIKNQKVIAINNDLIFKINDQKKKHRISERNIIDWLYAIYFNRQSTIVKKIFKAEITDVSRGGIRAKLIKTGATVFIPSSLLHPIKHELFIDYENGLIYVKNIIVYKVTDVIEVNLVEVRMENRNIIAKPVNY